MRKLFLALSICVFGFASSAFAGPTCSDRLGANSDVAINDLPVPKSYSRNNKRKVRKAGTGVRETTTNNNRR